MYQAYIVDMKINIKQTYSICNPSWWRLTKQTIIMATAVTEDGREVHGLGAHIWSKDKATDRAIENAKEMAAETDLSFTINVVTVPNQRVSYSFLDEQGLVRSQHNPSFGGRPTVEVTVSDGERQADGKGKQGLIQGLGLGWGGQFSDATQRAVQSAEKSLQRTGVTTVDS